MKSISKFVYEREWDYVAREWVFVASRKHLIAEVRIRGRGPLRFRHLHQIRQAVRSVWSKDRHKLPRNRVTRK